MSYIPECKPVLNAKFTKCNPEIAMYKRTLVYHPSNSKKGFPIKGTNLRVSFEYIKQHNDYQLPPNAWNCRGLS